MRDTGERKRVREVDQGGDCVGFYYTLKGLREEKILPPKPKEWRWWTQVVGGDKFQVDCEEQ